MAAGGPGWDCQAGVSSPILAHRSRAVKPRPGPRPGRAADGPVTACYLGPLLAACPGRPLPATRLWGSHSGPETRADLPLSGKDPEASLRPCPRRGSPGCCGWTTGRTSPHLPAWLPTAVLAPCLVARLRALLWVSSHLPLQAPGTPLSHPLPAPGFHVRERGAASPRWA